MAEYSEYSVLYKRKNTLLSTLSRKTSLFCKFCSILCAFFLFICRQGGTADQKSKSKILLKSPGLFFEFLQNVTLMQAVIAACGFSF